MHHTNLQQFTPNYAKCCSWCAVRHLTLGVLICLECEKERPSEQVHTLCGSEHRAEVWVTGW